MEAGTMGLGAVFDHGDAEGAGQIADGRHVCGPTAQVHNGDGLRAGVDQRSNGGCGDGTRIWIDIGEHGLGTQQHGAGGCGDEGAWGGDEFIALAQTDRQVGSRESQGAVGHGYGMAAAAPAGVLVLESLGVLAGPGVHLTGCEHAGSGVDLLGIEVGPGGEGHERRNRNQG